MEDSKKPSVPAWQQVNADDASTAKDTLEHARAFLEDDTVKAASPEGKREFLKSKGLSDSQITQLLEGPEREEESQSSDSHSTSTSGSSATATATPDDVSDVVNHKTDQKIDTHPETREAASPSTVSSTYTSTSPTTSFTTASPPPIITYPEFLTKPQRPPPIITPSRLAHIIGISGGVWALIYGISGLFVRPMVDSLNEARSEYYDHVNGKLARLVEALEGAVSEVPYKNGKPLRSQQRDRTMDDNDSVTSDPTELFHRDVGTQTSPPPSILGNDSNGRSGSEKPVDVQARQLATISSSLRELTLMHTQKTESDANLRSALGEVRDQVDKLAYPPAQDFTTFGGLTYGQSADPDDEFKKTKDAIRSAKGLFLSSRSFPAVATR